MIDIFKNKIRYSLTFIANIALKKGILVAKDVIECPRTLIDNF